MSILSDLLAENTTLEPAGVDHLQWLVTEWQLLADLSFADLLLWVPTTRGDLLCVAQVRPTTGPTTYQEDQVGRRQPVDAAFPLAVALRERRICREADPDWDGDLPVRREGIPVRKGDQVIAVLSRDTNLAAARSPSALELAYLQAAGELCQMVAEGTFPTAADDPEAHVGPRAGDGLLRVDATGVVVYASPNALSAYRRLGVAGDVRGTELGPLTRSLATDPFDGEEVANRIRAAVAGQRPERMEIDAGGATVLVRALPLRPGGAARGALVLIRDVTEVRRRDRQLMTKDATIREIHHRVKNNLQTVAALLRLQSRRTSHDSARDALTESVRRVTSIAMVHETLAQSVDERVNLDELVDRVVPMMGDLAGTDGRVTVRREGDFGVVSADRATALVLVLTELLQNAFEHAYPAPERGEVVLHVDRGAKWLDVLISDTGKGLPRGFSLERTERLGLQIVRTLVDSELRGSLSLRRRERGGT
ncbi:MAG TPA: histidine kinase N-terminal domain-containing protein, partial [Mycobacteriales bacterium]